MFRFSMVVVAALFASDVSAQFVLDLSTAEIRKREGVMALEDLAIEETGLVSYPGFCNENGELFVSRSSTLAKEASDLVISYRVQRKQGNVVIIETRKGARSDAMGQNLLPTLRGASQKSCGEWNLKPDQLFRVQSINGALKATELLKQPE